MKLQKLYSPVRRAIDDYHMIEEGDRIAVGVSGGKDSLTLLYGLAGLRRFYPKHFELIAITVDLGYPDFSLEAVEKLCEDLQVEYHIVKTEIKDILEKSVSDGSPCSLCARLRKGALNNAILSYHCNKVAYAHHMDDIIETMFLSMIYEGRFYSFSPVTHLDKTNLTVIRPLMYVTEAEVIGFKNKYALPVVKNPCPADGHTKREYAKQLVRKIHKDNPGAKERIFRAIVHGHIEGWPTMSSFTGQQDLS